MPHTPPSPPRSLLIHDGDLVDVRALLVSLRVPFTERIGPESDEDRRTRWDVVIASARRLLELQLPHSSNPPTQIAILSHDARTLRSSLRRTGTTLIVRRPVHPAALRALVLHSIYRGPEKRRAARVNVGAPVRLKVGWRRRDAILVDLSVNGCRVVTDRPLERDKTFRLEIPSDIASGRALAVDALVVQCIANADPVLGRFVSSATFESLSARLHAQLAAVVAAHAEGPAVCHGAPSIAAGASAVLDAAVPASSVARVPIAVPPAGPAAVPEPLEVDAESEPDEVASADLAVEESGLEGTAVSENLLDEEAARVLVGRDLSRIGMRVDPNPTLAVGWKLRLAVHAETREQPLILSAVVDRDEGERGLVLRFSDLSPELVRYLDYVIHALPLVIDDDDEEGCLIAELLEAS